VLDQPRRLAHLSVAVELDGARLGQVEVAVVLARIGHVLVGDPDVHLAIIQPPLDAPPRREPALGVGARARDRDDALDEGLHRLGLGQRGADLAVLEEPGREIAQHRAAVGARAMKLFSGDAVPHGELTPGRRR
jgi:hypothetical protein